MLTNFCLFFRTLVFNIGYYGSGIILGALCLLLRRFIPYSKRWYLLMHWNRFVIFWLNFCCNVKVEIKDLRTQDYPPSIIMAKHQSTWETLFLSNYFAPISIILKKELLKIPFFGWGLAALNPIAIDRTSPMQALKDINSKSIERLKEGNNVLIFPEGTRTPLGETRKYARSGADIACIAKVAVIPVAHNAGEIWPHKHFLKYPGTITVIIGDAIATEGRHRKEVTEEVKCWIESQISKMPVARKDGIYSHAQAEKPTV